MKLRRPTKIETVGIVVFLFVIVIIPVKGILRASWSADEAGAILALRTIADAEDTFRSECLKDQDGDGIGEYGTFAELAGLNPPAGKASPVDPPFINVELGGGTRYHYTFEVLLGEPTPDGTQGVDTQEQRYVAVAWPVKGSRSWKSHRSFIVDQNRKVYGGNLDGEKPPASALRPPTSFMPLN